MSDYLVRRIASSPRVTLHTRTEITAFHGDDTLTAVTWTDRSSGQSETRTVGNVFMMIGAVPNTGWLADCVALDPKGFVPTGFRGDGTPSPSPYATTVPGLYAVGDVRAGSVKRVASGVGEGSVVVQAVHGFLNPEP
jgi:thioredoxin reductase (NADPH)